MYCTNCGKPISDGSKFCPYCGTPVAVTSFQEPADNETDVSKNDSNYNENIEQAVPKNQQTDKTVTEEIKSIDEQPKQTEQPESQEYSEQSEQPRKPGSSEQSDQREQYVAQGRPLYQQMESNASEENVKADTFFDYTQENAAKQTGIPNTDYKTSGAAGTNPSYTQDATNDQSRTKSDNSKSGGLESKLKPIVDVMNKGLDGLGYFGLGVILVLAGIYMVISGHWITVVAIIVFLLVMYGIIKISNDRARLVVLALCVLIGVFSWFFTGTNKYVSQIQNSTLTAYSGKTVGKAFNDFFANPKWDYDGKNDDGDRVVVFTGKCVYLDETVTAKIEFTLDDRGSNSTFNITSLKFNNIEQPDLILLVLLNEIYE